METFDSIVIGTDQAGPALAVLLAGPGKRVANTLVQFAEAGS